MFSWTHLFIKFSACIIFSEFEMTRSYWLHLLLCKELLLILISKMWVVFFYGSFLDISFSEMNKLAVNWNISFPQKLTVIQYHIFKYSCNVFELKFSNRIFFQFLTGKSFNFNENISKNLKWIIFQIWDTTYEERWN